MEIADCPHFLFDVAPFHFLRKRGELLCRKIARQQRLENRLSGEHAALHGQVDSLQPLRIEEARRIADDQRAIHVRARHGVPAAVREGLRAVAH